MLHAGYVKKLFNSITLDVDQKVTSETGKCRRGLFGFVYDGQNKCATFLTSPSNSIRIKEL